MSFILLGFILAIMQVHEDFFNYKTGIYRHITSTNEDSENIESFRHMQSSSLGKVISQKSSFNTLKIKLKIDYVVHLVPEFLVWEVLIQIKNYKTLTLFSHYFKIQWKINPLF